MSKRVLAILVAALLAVGIFSAVANAGVDGSFKFDIWVWPQTTAAEASNLDFDIEARLIVNITFSGLTIGNKIAMGIPGLEHYILSLKTTLGALDLSDEFVFATPFYGCPYGAPGKYNYIDYFFAWPAFTGCKPFGDMMFVKKRVNAEISIGGLTFSNLIMFEDVNFPAPRSVVGKGSVQRYFYAYKNGSGTYWLQARRFFMPVSPVDGSFACEDAALTVAASPACDPTTTTVTIVKKYCAPDGSIYVDYTVSGVTTTPPDYSVCYLTFTIPSEYQYPTTYTTAEQVFHFGDIMGISGTTVSGIEIGAKAAFCADWTIDLGFYTIGKQLFGWGFEPDVALNQIKKATWLQAACYNGDLALTKEFISIENLGFIPNLTLNTYLLMTLKPTFNGFIEAAYTLPMGLGTLYSWFNFTGGLALGGPALNAILLSLENIKLLWYDVDGDLSLSVYDEVFGVMTLDVQAAALLFEIYMIPTKGIQNLLVEIDLPISYPEPIGTLEVTGLWANDPAAGGLVFDSVDFKMSKSFGEHNSFLINAMFSADGLQAVDFSITTTFSL